MPVTGVTACEVHPLTKHRPAAQRDEEDHHVIPRHWQQLWTPEKAPYPGVFKEFGVWQQLWDARTVKVPPTCHRNVHHWLVALMHELAQLRAVPFDSTTVVVASKAVSKVNALRDKMALQELQWAAEAPLRFLAAGGDIGLLVRAQAWGES
jgi:hypothetical protein